MADSERTGERTTGALARFWRFGKRGAGNGRDGREALKPVASRRALFREADIHGLIHWLSGMPMPDLDETLIHAGITRRDLVKLEADDEIAAALETRMLAVLATPHRFESEDEAAAELARETLAPMLEDALRHAWQAVLYGYSVIEMVWARRDGRIVPDRLLAKPFWWFEPLPDGGLVAAMNPEERLDTRFKFFLTRRRPGYARPHGEALLSRLFWPWYFRQQGWDHWMRWLARFGTPPLIGEGGTDLEALRAALEAAVNAAAVAVPDGTKVNVAAPGSSGSHFPEFERVVSRRIQKVILGQTLTSDADKGGSYAAAKVHDEVRDDRRVADVKLVAGTIQRIVDAVVALNGLSPVRFVMEDERGLQAERARRDATLAQAGIARFSKEYLLRAYDFEEGDVEAAQADRAAPQGFAAGPTRFSADAGEAAGKGPRFTPAQEELEALIAEAISGADGASPIDPEAIAAEIRRARDADDLAGRLARLAERHAGGMEPDAFSRMLEAAMFAADVHGFVNAERGRA